MNAMPTPPTTPPLPQPPRLEEVHLSDYINVILRRRKTFLAAFIVVFCGVALYTFLMKPVYEASATLHVKDEKSKSGVLGELALSEMSPVDSEIEIIKARSNAEEVVRQLHLDWQVTRKSAALSFTLLDFTSSAADPAYRVEVSGGGGYTVRDADGELVGTGRSGTLMRGKGVTLLVTDLAGKPGDGFTLRKLPFNPTVQGIRSAVKAVEVGNKTGIIQVSYQSTDPVLARDVVSALVGAYLDKTVALKAEEANRTVDFVNDQIKGVRADLDKAESDLEKYKATSRVVDLGTEASDLVKKTSEVETQRAGLALQLKQIGFSLASLRDAMRKGKVYIPAPSGDKAPDAAIAGRLADLVVQKRALATELTPAHPQVKAIQAQIDELQRKLETVYETSLKNLHKEEGDISQRMGGLEGELSRLPAAERDLAGLMRLAKVNSDIYTFLLQKHEEARIAKASTISNVDVIDPAIIPDRPIKPHKAKNLLLGLLVGAMLGVGLAFFQEYLDDTIKDADEAKRAVQLPLLATIPHISGRGGGESLEAAGALITQREPKSSVAEAFRSLRTSLHFSAINREKKIVLLTSSFPGEGKSTICANLAHTLAQTGARVLVVDCDLRRSSLHEKFGHSKVPGLTELLTGDADFASVRHDTGIPGLDLVSAGTTPPNPAELLGSPEMRRFLESQRESYDQIIIDAPPVLAVTDAPVLTAMADRVLVVMEAGRVPLKAAQRMRETLATVQAPVAGLVVNDKSGKGESYGYYGGRYGYGYGYGYYSDGDQAAAAKPWWRRVFKR